MKKTLVIVALLLFSTSGSHAQGYIFQGDESGLLLSGGMVQLDSEFTVLLDLGYTHKGVIDAGISYQSSKINLSVSDFQGTTSERVGLNVLAPYVIFRTPNVSSVFVQAEASAGYAFFGSTDFLNTEHFRVIPWSVGVSAGTRARLNDIITIYPHAGFSAVWTNVKYEVPTEVINRDNAISETVTDYSISLGVSIAIRAKEIPQILAVRPFVSRLTGEDPLNLYGLTVTLGMGTIQE